MKKLYNRQSVIEKKVGEKTDRTEKAKPIYAYLIENSDECQFSLNDLISKIEGDSNLRTIISFKISFIAKKIFLLLKNRIN